MPVWYWQAGGGSHRPQQYNTRIQIIEFQIQAAKQEMPSRQEQKGA
jgi:hypothetical protein